MKILNKPLHEFSAHKYSRIDTKYWATTDGVTIESCVFIQDLFDVINGSVQTANYSNEVTSIPYVRIGDISYKYGLDLTNAMYLNDGTEIKQDKILKDDDIIVATIGATVGKTAMAKGAKGGTFSNNTIVLRKKSESIDSNFYALLLQTDYYINYIFGVVSQKAQPNLQDYDLRNIRVPFVPNDVSELYINKVLEIENDIASLKSQLVSMQSIVDDSFKDEFGFCYGEFERLRTIKTFSSSLTDFADNPDVRMSAKFHRNAGDFVMQELSNITTKKVKHYLSEPIVLGASISPSNYDDDGEVYYLSMATIKNWEFSPDDARTVFSHYVDDKKAKTIQKNDIILARSGEGTIGKVAFIEDGDLAAVFADFTMRIRLKNYNSKFAYYYFRTTYFQYLIEIYKKGLGNNTNIFPIVIKEFPLPDIEVAEQDRIVANIQEEIDKQNNIKSKIEQLRAQIDDIIENAIHA